MASGHPDDREDAFYDDRDHAGDDRDSAGDGGDHAGDGGDSAGDDRDNAGGGADAAGEPASTMASSAIIGEILDEFLTRLESGHSALLREPATTAELERQVRFILEDVFGHTRPTALQTMEPTGEGRLFSIDVGTRRAQRGVHPIESLRAGSELFAVALPIIAARTTSDDAARLLAVSLTLHEAIMGRIILASMSYVELLLDKLRASREEERRRVARELHDRVGHGMALALQHIDLSRFFASSDADRSQSEVGIAMAALTDALHTVGLLAAELRRSVGNDGLEGPLRAYLMANIPAGIRSDLRVNGDPKTLPPNVSEEVYLIMREAARNAVRHSRPTELRLRVDIGEETVTASVTDNGIGFDQAAIRSDTGGMLSMFERAELLLGTLEVISEIGLGTRVEIRVPLSTTGT